MKIKEYVVKLQGLPEPTKKVILWITVAVFAIVIGFFWIRSADYQISKIGESFKSADLPKIDIPQDAIDTFSDVKNIVDDAKAVVDSNLQTDDWKIYTNEKYRYQINYPPDWTFKEYPDTKIGAGFRPLDKPNEVAYEFINVGNYDRGSDYCDIPFSEYVKTALAKEAGSGEAVLISTEKIDNVNGVDSYKTIWDEPPHGSDSKHLIIGPITYFGSGKQDCKSPQASLNNNDYIDVYDKMITTFRFTE